MSGNDSRLPFGYEAEKNITVAIFLAVKVFGLLVAEMAVMGFPSMLLH
jgi:hypothetical protein